MHRRPEARASRAVSAFPDVDHVCPAFRVKMGESV